MYLETLIFKFIKIDFSPNFKVSLSLNIKKKPDRTTVRASFFIFYSTLQIDRPNCKFLTEMFNKTYKLISNTWK